MAIVKMQQLRLIALTQDRDALLAELLHAGCVEVSEPTQTLAEGPDFLRREDGAVAKAKDAQGELKAALEALSHNAPQKGGLFTPRTEMSEKDFLDQGALETALALAREINGHAKAIGACSAQETRLEADRMALEPWRAYDVPLEVQGTRTAAVLLGTVPAAVDFPAMAGAVEEAAGAAEIRLLSGGRQQQCLEVICHRDCQEAALEALRSYGFSFAQMKEMRGTVEENLLRLQDEIGQIQEQRQREIEAIRALGPRKRELQIAQDRAAQALRTESTKERLLNAGPVLYLDGWVPAEAAGKLEQVLAGFDCAYELTDPPPEEYPQVPVQLKNNALTRPLNMVTEMYSLPAYGSMDPNPLMAPFFILFYGIMLADMGYGLLMILGSIFVLKKVRPQGTMNHLFSLMGLCGVSTFIMGAITGGFFGDFLTQLVSLVSPGTVFALPSLFTPLNDTLMILIGSMALGFIQVVTGMAISLVAKVKAGQFLDAFFEEVTWWVVFAGIGLMAAGVTNVVLYAGIALVVAGPLVTGKGFGKIIGIFGSVYNHVTGFFGDVLSYSRLMALMLAGSVIAQVFNTLGAIPGNVVIFLVISIAGNALNFALNLLGCYVHDLRLQCLEFFGKFYQDGGKPFQPFEIKTKFVDIVKE